MNKEIELMKFCPGCKSSLVTTLKQAETNKIFVTDGEELDITTGLSCCEECGLTFLNPKMSQEKLFEYYSKQSRLPRSEVVTGSPFDEQMQIQIDYIKQFVSLKDNFKVLEIGCAEGFFLKKFQDSCHRQNIFLYGVELSKKYLEQAEKNLKNAVIFDTPLEETNFKELKFDLIVLRHVFEHLSEPANVLASLRNLLQKDGVLYIEVPDSQNIVAQLSTFYHHEHLLYFTPVILENYFESQGFETIRSERFENNPVGSGFEYPVIRGICKVGEYKPLKKFPHYAQKNFMDNELTVEEAHRLIFDPLRKKVQEQSSRGRNIALFGAGPHTMDILKKLDDLKVDWVCVMDNNKNKHGKKMRNIPIVQPTRETLQKVDCVVISSAAFEKEMFMEVKKLSPETKIITIYDQF